MKMLELLFGWRKAAKWKKLIKRVQCRLKLLKNKRCFIVKQLREDVAQLLQHGHRQTAFDRVEQIFEDERMISVYDLLENFCEFILMNLGYIRKHKDCPNDIREAASSLIYASARFGDLPELRDLRKIFGERYGQRFAVAALELLPGNLVNLQIKEKLCAKTVPDDVKHRLIDEIARTCIGQEPLLIEYNKPELQPQLEYKSSSDMVSSNDPQIDPANNGYKQSVSNISEAEGKILHVDLSSESMKFANNQVHPNGNWLSMPPLGSTHNNRMAEESSSETSAQLPEEMIYLDDIEEFMLPSSKDWNLRDQRLFMFKSLVIPLTAKMYYEVDSLQDQVVSPDKRPVGRSSRKGRPTSGKRTRRRSVSQESRLVTDVQCAIYYGEPCKRLQNDNRKPYYQRKHQKKISVDEKRTSLCAQGNVSPTHEMISKCSLESPCYFWTTNELNAAKSPSFMFNMSISTPEVSTKQNLKEQSDHGDGGFDFLPLRTEEMYQAAAASSMSKNIKYPSRDSNVLDKESSVKEENLITPYLRMKTMPPERPRENLAENISRSNSFPFEQPSNLCNGSNSHRHIHPKLPDYDELAAKFMALKKATMAKQQSRQKLRSHVA